MLVARRAAELQAAQSRVTLASRAQAEPGPEPSFGGKIRVWVSHERCTRAASVPQPQESCYEPPSPLSDLSHKPPSNTACAYYERVVQRQDDDAVRNIGAAAQTLSVCTGSPGRRHGGGVQRTHWVGASGGGVIRHGGRGAV